MAGTVRGSPGVVMAMAVAAAAAGAMAVAVALVVGGAAAGGSWSSLDLSMPAVAAAVSSPEGNLAPNPGFEEVDPKNVALPVGWRGWNSTGTQAEFVVLAGAGREGSRAAAIRNVSAGATAVWIPAGLANHPSVTAGKEYVLVVWVRAEGASTPVAIDIRWLDEKGNGISVATGDPEQSRVRAEEAGNWYRLVVVAVAPEKAAFAQIRLHADGCTKGTVYFDDVWFGEAGAMPASAPAPASPLASANVSEAPTGPIDAPGFAHADPLEPLRQAVARFTGVAGASRAVYAAGAARAAGDAGEAAGPGEGWSPTREARRQAYVESAAQAIYRLMSMQQFRPERPYYGSFDQMHWLGQAEDKLSLYSQARPHNARFQEASLTLAWFFRHDPTGRWKGNQELRARAQAGLAFWARSQWPDGSFAETNSTGHEFGTTAFTLTAAVEAVRLIGDEWDESLVPRQDVLRAIRRAALFLLGRDGNNNLQAAAGLALAEAGLLLDDPGLLRAGAIKIEKLLDLQSPEGFFPEMGGPDTGYNSLTLSLLGRYRFVVGDQIPRELEKRLLAAVERSLWWQSLFIDPYGSLISGRWNTRSQIPWMTRDRFEAWVDYFPLAERMSSVLPISGSMGLDSDDRHLCTETYRYLWAYEELVSAKQPEQPGAGLLPAELARLLPPGEDLVVLLPHTRVRVTAANGKYAVEPLE